MIITIKNDGLLDISTGESRNETNWKNQEILWSALVKKLSKTKRTSETVSEYKNLTKEQQDIIKDVGGFVGGIIHGGRRKNGSITSRQLITLDIDHSKTDLWAKFCVLYGNGACTYTTHKHTQEEPRSRLIIPLDRPVFTDEYEAIARKIAGTLSIEAFDITTFQPTRLMYWPSTSTDGEYVFKYQDGEFLEADTVLAGYADWRDSSQWPVSIRHKKTINHNVSKQENPLDKDGIIGAWCKAYSITEVIEEHLKDVYEPTDDPTRFTYIDGSTSKGLAIFDELFAYSFHGTDAISGKLCNSFDLVRLHKFGELDSDIKDTPSSKLPSFKAMSKFALKQPAVKRVLVNEKLKDAAKTFAELPDSIPGDEDLTTEKLNKKKSSKKEPEDAESWKDDLDVDGNGDCYNTIDNVLLILNNDLKLKGCFAFNDFEKREVALKKLPWRTLKPGKEYLTDRDDSATRHYFEKSYGIGSKEKIADGMSILFMNNTFHPVKEYLEGLQWDGIRRLDTVLIDYLGAEDTKYVRAVTRKWFTAAVARIYEPGIKFDYALVTIGREGIGKSTIIDKLAGNWFSDSLGTIENNGKTYEQLQGVWIMELAELSSLKKAETETVKHFVAKRIDKYRVAYGKRVENFPRQTVFFGTTNKHDFLKGINGDRRFWPVDTEIQPVNKTISVDLTPEEIAQIWAEAVLRYIQKEKLFLSEELEVEAREVQKLHAEVDARAAIIEEYLNILLPENWDKLGIYERIDFLQSGKQGTILRERVCIAEIWCELFRGQIKEMNTYNTKDLHNIMKNMQGWQSWTSDKTRFKLYGLQKAYVRKDGKTVKRWDIKTISKN